MPVSTRIDTLHGARYQLTLYIAGLAKIVTGLVEFPGHVVARRASILSRNAVESHWRSILSAQTRVAMQAS